MKNSKRDSIQEALARLQQILSELEFLISEIPKTTDALESRLKGKESPNDFVKRYKDGLIEKKAVLRDLDLEDKYRELKEEFEKLTSQWVQDSGE